MVARRVLAWGLVFALALQGCAGVPRKTTETIPGDLRDLKSWQAIGRIGVSGSQSGGSGSFEWLQRGDRADVEIRGPIGIGSVRLQMNGDSDHPTVRLETSKGVLESQAAWDELEARLGTAVPAGRLRYWMLGIPAPGEHQWGPAAPDGAITLEQDGWRIDYQTYSEKFGARVPLRIRASSGEAHVRIVIDRWQLGQ